MTAKIEQTKHTIPEAAQYLSVKPGYVYRLIHTGKLQCVSGKIRQENLEECKKYLGKYILKRVDA
jgi:excisionase family DNA binding protein